MVSPYCRERQVKLGQVLGLWASGNNNMEALNRRTASDSSRQSRIL